MIGVDEIGISALDASNIPNLSFCRWGTTLRKVYKIKNVQYFQNKVRKRVG